MTCAVMLSAASAGRSRWVTPQPAAKAAAIESVVVMRFMDGPPWAFLVSGCYAAKSKLTSARGRAGERKDHARPGINLGFCGLALTPKPWQPKSPSQAARAALSCRQLEWRNPMRKMFGRLAGALLALALGSGFAAAQSKITVAVGGGACLCYLPTVLAKQLGEFEKAGLAVELVDLKGGSDALRAVLGGSADVVSGYFDHCVNLAAKKQELQAFVVYDRYPGLVLVVSPSHTGQIKSIKDLAGKKVAVSHPG